MSATEVALDTPVTSSSGAERRAVRPVLLLACLGVVMTGVSFYVLGSWLLSDPHRIQPGPTPVPTYMRVFAIGFQIAAVIAVVAMAYLVIVRPLRRDGRIGFNGLLCLACLVGVFQDPVINYMVNVGNYNSYYLNLGGWANHIPGWSSPNGDRIPQALLIDLALYFVVIPCLAMLGGKMLGVARSRWPELSMARLLVGCFAAWVPVTAVAEIIMLRTGIYSYAATGGWSLFPGTFYSLPLYEPILMAFVWVGFSALCYFRNEKGQTLAERGIDRVPVGPRSQTLIRFFAIVGAIAIVAVPWYGVAVQAFTIHQGPWPDSVLERPYFVNGLCGPDTEHAVDAPAEPAPSCGEEPHDVDN